MALFFLCVKAQSLQSLLKLACFGVWLFVIYHLSRLYESSIPSHVGIKQHLNQDMNNSVVYNNSDEQFNNSVVYNNSDERFIFFVGIAEQETKAQLHMRSVSFLSNLVNRTIVIPNVGRSRLGACFNHPFSTYYESDEWLTKNKDRFRYISHQGFVDWLDLQELLGRRPTGQRARVGLKASSTPQSNHISNCDLEWSPKFNLGGIDAEPVVLDMTEHLSNTFINEKVKMKHMTEIVKEFISNIDAQVILLQFGPANKWLQIPEVNKLIPYSRHLEDRSRAILEFIKPSLVVHWRMETVPKWNIPKCAKLLVDDIHHLKAKGKMAFENIYFMTDYPLVGKHSRSDSFQVRKSKNHMEAIEYVKMHLNLTSAFYDDGLEKRPKNETHPVTGTTMTFLPVAPVGKKSDRGQLGIIEKIVAENARYFSAAIYGSKWHKACGRRSNYANIIVSERRRIIMSERHLPSKQRRLANGVHYWGT